ncbi:NnrS family protein [Inhella proteolytica]|uniref:NnrS family protein n=1 Tax=Inhella proteolytica TaxID=2795029 RepID=A0A931NHH2_9BURK|nr:NnrS family protein [Inhella proteolytica]MBH9577054.1 NnrS family protein [Inhella proteolytica]
MATFPLHMQAPPPMPPAPPQSGWRLARLLSAPHRLGFFSAAVWLALSALWWGAVLLARACGLEPPWAVAPAQAHGLLLAFSFMPLFIVGFLFTAGPRWLAQPEVDARDLLPGVLALLMGWLLVLPGVHFGAPLAAAGVAVAAGGWALLLRRYLHILRASQVADRLHAQIVAGAAAYGLLALALAAFALWQGQAALLGAAIQLALWGFLAPVFTAVSHRMLPFFTQAVLPALEAWRPEWLLVAMLSALGATALAGFASALWSPLPALLLAALALVQAAAAGLLLWLALRWGLLHSLRGKGLRLLAMLHGGFVWLGLAFALGAASNALQAAGQASLGLAPLHALTMGYLGCTLIAMITRVSAGHSGRPLAVDGPAWALYLLLQAAVLARVLAALWPAQATPLTLAAIGGWALACVSWALRYGSWLGRPRADGRPG